MEPEIELRPEHLLQQTFPDMNHYENAQQDCIDRFRGEYEFLSNFYPARLATGKCCFLKAKATRTAVDTIRGWLRSHADTKHDVVICCTDHRIYDLVCEELSGGNGYENLREK